MFSDLVVLAVLIFFNSLFAAAEAAMISVNTTKIKLKADDGDSTAKTLKNMIDEPSKFLAAIQIGISLISLFSGAYAAQSFSDNVVEFMLQIGITLPESVIKPVTIFIITILLSYFSMVLGELVPKRLAMKYPEKIALKATGPLYVITKLASPFVKILSASTEFVAKFFGCSEISNESDVTEEEIRMMLDVGDSIDEAEKEMINNIFEFDNKTVGNICTHRTDIVAVDIKTKISEIIKLLIREGYSRIPVYEGNIDNIVGILHIKDLFIFLSEDIANDDLKICTVMRKPVFVPLSKKTDELFSEMQKNKIHMVIVIDEYGGTVGLVTMEDLIEEIMGSILDEYDEEERPDIEAIDENTFFVSGTTPLDEVSEFFGVPLPVSDYDTVGGFIIGQIGNIPAENDHPEIEFNGLIFKVFSVLEKRIAEIIVCKV